MPVRPASTSGKKMKQTKTPEYRRVLNDYPPGYNAHRDQLADEWQHAENVNELLKVLREAVGVIDAMVDALVSGKPA